MLYHQLPAQSLFTKYPVQYISLTKRLNHKCIKHTDSYTDRFNTMHSNSLFMLALYMN